MFNTIFVQPIYNIFVAILGHVPQGDVILAIIGLTVLIRLVFYPTFTSSIKTQMGMAVAQEEIDEIKRSVTDREEQARATLAVYKKHDIKPFSSLLALLVQLPVFFALYFALFREHIKLPTIETDQLYSFVHAPVTVSTDFFGIFNVLASHNAIVAGLVFITQFYAFYLTTARMKRHQKTNAAGVDSTAQMLQTQQKFMLYVMPVLFATIAYSMSALIGVYFIAMSMFSVVQEWLVRQKVA